MAPSEAMLAQALQEYLQKNKEEFKKFLLERFELKEIEDYIEIEFVLGNTLKMIWTKISQDRSPVSEYDFTMTVEKKRAT